MIHRTIAFTGPSAVGKTYIADQLMDKHPGKFKQAKLYTTRKPRDGESATDRIFVSNEEFSGMVDNNFFVVHDVFGGNKYGFTKESLYPTDKHLLVNIWPRLCTKVSTLPTVVIVGLQAPEDWEALLVQRMKDRGDSDQTIEVRKQLILKDTQDLKDNKAIVEKHGAYFIIKNNQTVPSKVIPWLEKELGLKS